MSTKELKRLIQKFNADFEEYTRLFVAIGVETDEDRKDELETGLFLFEHYLQETSARIKAANPSRYMLQRYPELKDIMEYE